MAAQTVSVSAAVLATRLSCRWRGRVNGRPGGFTVGDGLRYCFGRDPSGRSLHGGRRRIFDFCAGRITGANRRPHQGAFVVIVAGIIVNFGLSGLFMVTLMAGVLLIAMGITGFGAAVKFIPKPDTIGFTNGIAVLIASTQIKNFLGLPKPTVPSDFIQRMKVLAQYLSSLDGYTVTIATTSLAIILFSPRLIKKIPGSIVALFLGTCVVAVFHLPIATIGSQFGGIPFGLPSLAIPEFRADLIIPLLPSAFTVAILAAVESLLSAVVADGIERRQTQFQRRVDCPRDCQLGESPRGRYTCHGSDRAYGDQHTLRR